MKKEDSIKVSFSISLTKTYDVEDIVGFRELNSLVSDDLNTTLLQMIQIDVIDAIGEGKGSFKIID